MCTVLDLHLHLHRHMYLHINLHMHLHMPTAHGSQILTEVHDHINSW